MPRTVGALWPGPGRFVGFSMPSMPFAIFPFYGEFIVITTHPPPPLNRIQGRSYPVSLTALNFRSTDRWPMSPTFSTEFNSSSSLWDMKKIKIQVNMKINMITQHISMASGRLDSFPNNFSTPI